MSSDDLGAVPTGTRASSDVGDALHPLSRPPGARAAPWEEWRRLRNLPEEVWLGIFILLAVIVSANLSDVFFTEYNILNLLRQISYTVIVSLGQLMVVLTGSIDLSVGATMQIVQMVMIEFAADRSVPVLVALALAVGGIIGLVNGLLVTKARLQPFIATLGTWNILEGIVLLYTKGQGTSSDAREGFLEVGSGYVGRFPNPVIVAAVLAVVAWGLLTKTTFGRSVYAVGANALAVRYSGLNPSRYRVAVFVISGMLAAIAGFLVAARTGAFQPATIHGGATGMELSSIAAVVLGGTSLSGGKGSVVGAVLGALVAGLLYNVLVLLNVNPYIQQLLVGLIILAAVLLTAGERRRQR